MKTYELTYIISPEITSEEALAVAKEFESFVSNNEGSVLKQTNPTARALSYPVGKKASGFFGVLEFQLEPEKVVELKKIIEKTGNVVRHMIIIKEPAKFRKERRTKSKVEPTFEIERKTEVEEKTEEQPAQTKEKEKEKVELKDIEQKLDELLG